MKRTEIPLERWKGSYLDFSWSWLFVLWKGQLEKSTRNSNLTIFIQFGQFDSYKKIVFFSPGFFRLPRAFFLKWAVDFAETPATTRQATNNKMANRDIFCLLWFGLTSGSTCSKMLGRLDNLNKRYSLTAFLYHPSLD